MTIIVHSKNLTQLQIQQIEASLSCKLVFNLTHYRSINLDNINNSVVNNLRAELQLDINILPSDFIASQIRLIISDMDSTLINIECIDEMAAFAGLKPEVVAITELAMRGELDFNQALIKRVKLLQGLDIQVLENVYQQKLSLNPGAERLITTAQRLNIKFALVSGGFDFFTHKLQTKLNLDFTRANSLAISQQKLTGDINGEIINGQQKLFFLQELCQLLHINLSQVIAIGDGANDLLMLEASGLSVAYYAHAKVRSQTQVQINYSGLDSVLDFLA